MAYQARPPYKSVEGLGTEPWKKLSRNGAYVLDLLYAKFWGNPKDRRALSLTFREVRNKMSNRLFAKGMLEVICFGFVDVVKDGGINKKDGTQQKECTVYGFSNRWRRLIDKAERLEKIEAILKEIEILKRKKGGVEKRMKIRALRKEALNLSRR